MDPKTKIKILRTFEKNPGLALLHALDDMYKALLNSKELKGEKGDRGDTITPPSHAEIVRDLLAFFKSNPPKDGHTASEDELRQIIKPLIPKVKDGKSVSMKDIMPSIQTAVKKEIGALEKKLGSEIKGEVTEIISKGSESVFDTPEKIANKINSLEESIDPKTIKGLTTMLAKFQRALREKGGGKGGGGGMGNWVHERFLVTANQSSVSVKSNIAAGGTAGLVRYQGQLLGYGVEYSVNDNVVTLNFATEAGNYVDVTYVRS